MEQQTNELISIIVPVYNAEEYLVACIYSILDQTYGYFELILIDDGSTDNSLEICKRLGQKDKRIKIYHHENCGVSKTRNRGIKLAQGRYITFVDADDMVDRDYLSKLYFTLRQASNVDRSISICGLKRETTSGKIKVEIENYGHMKKSKERSFSMGLLIKDTLTSQIFGTSVRLLIPSELINDNRVEFVICRMHEDQLFFFDVASFAQEICICDEALYFYRYTDNSACHLQYKELLLKDTEVYLSALFTKVKDYDLSLEDGGIVIGLAMLNCRINLIKNAFSSMDPWEDIEKLDDSSYFYQMISDDSVALWKEHYTRYLRIVYILDKYHLLFLMPAVIKIKNMIKKLIRT